MGFKVAAGAVGAILVAALGFAGAANAANFQFDFADLAVGNEKGGDPLVFTTGSITLWATGTDSNDDDNQQFAYLDGPSGLGPAGLGVCSDILANLQCDPSSDDNAQLGETLTLMFNQEVTITDLVFRNARHETTFAGSTINVDSDAAGEDEMLALQHMISNLSITGTTFSFWLKDGAQDQFYIELIGFSTETRVPEPAALGLLGLGLAGLGAMRRRRTA